MGGGWVGWRIEIEPDNNTSHVLNEFHQTHHMFFFFLISKKISLKEQT